MHAHGVEVLDRADHDDVVAAVAHELELVLLPPDDRLLEEDLVGGARLEAGARDAQQVRLVVGNPGSGSAHGEGRAHDDRVPQADHRLAAVLDAVADSRARTLCSHVRHDSAEELAILPALNGVDIRTDELHAVALESAGAMQGHRGVESGLASEGGEQGIGALPLDDALDIGRRDGLDVRRIGEFRVGHDRRGIGVDEDHADALSLEDTACLGAGVVELAGLTDDDGP